MAEEHNSHEETSADDKRRELRASFDSINQTAKDLRTKTRELYAKADGSENERWSRTGAESQYLNEASENKSSGGE